MADGYTAHTDEIVDHAAHVAGTADELDTAAQTGRSGDLGVNTYGHIGAAYFAPAARGAIKAQTTILTSTSDALDHIAGNLKKAADVYVEQEHAVANLLRHSEE